MNSLLIRALNKFGILKKVYLNGNLSLNGKTFKIPLIEGEGFANLFMSEPWMIDLLKTVLPLGEKKFVDVGVNIGQTLLKLRSVSEIDYVGFEPNNLCVYYTSKLIKENGISNASLIPVGISDMNGLGELNFYFDTNTDSSASIIADFRPQQKVVRKEFIALADIPSIKNNIDLSDVSILKVDVEGAEWEVLNSFSKEIKSARPVIMMEILPAYNKENTSRVERQDKIQQLLKESNYIMFRVKKEGEVLKGFDEIGEVGIHSDLNACEYVMIPLEKKELFLSSYKKVLS
jgi:FkbM family methyltransferase